MGPTIKKFLSNVLLIIIAAFVFKYVVGGENVLYLAGGTISGVGLGYIDWYMADKALRSNHG